MSEPGPEGSGTIGLKVGMGSVPSRRNSWNRGQKWEEQWEGNEGVRGVMSQTKEET